MAEQLHFHHEDPLYFVDGEGGGAPAAGIYDYLVLKGKFDLARKITGVNPTDGEKGNDTSIDGKHAPQIPTNIELGEN